MPGRNKWKDGWRQVGCWDCQCPKYERQADREQPRENGNACCQFPAGQRNRLAMQRVRCDMAFSTGGINHERMNNDSTQQIPPRGDNGKNEVGGLLAAASNFARSVLGSIQALAWTAYCKGVQIARLKDWAISNDCWLVKKEQIEETFK